jgi:2,3-bisphosphoglycerate-independent phosphoglycerate mutase
VVYQDYTRINLAIEDGSFYANPALVEACRRCVGAGGALHLMGLVSDGGVHSHQEHLFALLELARRQGLGRVFVHAFLDGRDTPPQSGQGYLESLEVEMTRLGVGAVATVMGRFYAMDRDTRWDRVEKAFRAICRGEGTPAGSAREAVEAAYAEGQTDEFVVPRVIRGQAGGPLAPLADGDAVVFFNFRSDRARELTRAFTQADFSAFDVAGRPALSSYVCFTQYDETFDLPLAFPPARLAHLFGEVVAAAGLSQLRIAETEKYAHVTFFFNGGRETVFPGEDRILVPSPRDVKTYDHKPEMSAREVTDKLTAAIGTGQYGFVLVNFANPDMVGHTGLLDAAVKAVKVVDECVGRLWHTARQQGMAMLVTADHGNCEMMTDPATGEPHTAHTLNPVPFILADPDFRGAKLRAKGVLADVAPTCLQVMGLPQPKEMKVLGLVTR